MITKTKIETLSSYSLIHYLLDGTWRQYPRPFKDVGDAKRVAKSLIDSQSFNLSTTGGL